MKTAEATVDKSASSDALVIKHEKSVRVFVDACYDAWKSGKQKTLDGDKVLARVRAKIMKK